MKTTLNGVGRAILAMTAASAVMISPPRGWAAVATVSDQVSASVAGCSGTELEKEPTAEDKVELNATIANCTLPSKTGWIAINDPDGKTLSDFLFYGATSHFLSLVSDPLEPSEIPDKSLLLGTVKEMGKLQDVGKFFGVANDEIRVISDLNVPEPSTWTMMLLGFAGLGFVGYRASRKTFAQTAPNQKQKAPRMGELCGA
jgi:hypothetical protein